MKHKFLKCSCGRPVHAKKLCGACYKRKRYADCPEIRSAAVEANKKWIKSDTGRVLFREAQKRYKRKKLGFTEDLYKALIELQGDKCAICTAPLADLRCADHCHETSTPRGLLCRSCNLGLGHYEKNQKKYGLRIEPYEQYLVGYPTLLL